MKCSYQSDTKFDQSDCKLEVIVKLGDQHLSRGEVALFQRVPLQIEASRRYGRRSIISLLA